MPKGLRLLYDRSAPAGAEMLAWRLAGAVDFVLVDRLNYHYANRIYRKTTWSGDPEDRFLLKRRRVERGFEMQGDPVHMF